MSSQAWRVKVLKAEAVLHPPSYPLSTSVIRFEIDSGASAHFVNSSAGLDHFDSRQTMTVQVADQHSLRTAGVGDIQGKIKAVHVVPEFGTNLLSVLSLYKEGLATLFHPDHGVIIGPAKAMQATCHEVLGIGHVEDDSFVIDIKTSPRPPSNPSVARPASVSLPSPQTYAAAVSKSPAVISASTKARAELWIRRLGFPHPARMLAMIQRSSAYKLNLPSSIRLSDLPSSELDPYQLGKHRAHPHRNLNSHKTAKAPFEHLHLDIKVVNEPSYGKSINLLVIVCDYSRWKVAIPLVHRKAYYLL